MMAHMADSLLLTFARARAKLLARRDREMRSDLVVIRREAGLTQQDVADRMGCTQQAVYKLERYDADPKLSTLRRYANAVGALVEHHVEADRGQSLVLAEASRWEGSSRSAEQTIAVSPVPIRRVIPQSVHGNLAWAANTKRTDFALGA